MTTDRPEFSNDELYSLVVMLVQQLEQQAAAFRTIASAATAQALHTDRLIVSINELRPQSQPAPEEG